MFPLTIETIIHLITILCVVTADPLIRVKIQDFDSQSHHAVVDSSDELIRMILEDDDSDDDDEPNIDEGGNQ